MDHSMHGGSSSSSMSGMSGMDMSEGGCKISMIWNWNTIDACFISKQWRVRSVGDYVGSLIGIFFIVVALEMLRRFGRDYDRRIRAAYWRRETAALAAVASSSKTELPASALVPAPFCPSYAQQVVRSVFYGISFGTAYILMLLAMSYNGGVILAIFAGGAVGHFISARDTATPHEVETPDDSPQARGECCC
ncbi:copper transporter family protein [Sporobolomyces koalae]|uniref:copper transporter family protein n=1 Tax=Sporobolomyces koalae TaxID=500713 RepID=UPI003175A547